MEDFFKKIKTEDIIHFFVGIILGLMIVYWLRQLKNASMEKEVLDLQKELLEVQIDIVTKNDKQEKEVEKKPISTPKTNKEVAVFPLKKGSKGDKVHALHNFLISNYEAELEETKDYETQVFGDITSDFVQIHLKKDTISENYFNKAIA